MYIHIYLLLCIEISHSLFLFGGYGGKWMNDMYKYDMKLKIWNKVEQKGTIPKTRCGHGAVILQKLVYNPFIISYILYLYIDT